MWQVYSCIAIAVIVVSVLWVSCIDYIHTNYPNYKGDMQGFNFDDEDKEQEDVHWGENVEVVDDKNK